MINLVVMLILLLLPAKPFNSGGRFIVYFMIFLFLVQGLQSGGRTACGYCYFQEMAPQKYGSLMGTGWNVSEGVIYIYITIYYGAISKNWVPTIVVGAAL